MTSEIDALDEAIRFHLNNPPPRIQKGGLTFEWRTNAARDEIIIGRDGSISRSITSESDDGGFWRAMSYGRDATLGAAHMSEGQNSDGVVGIYVPVHTIK